MSVLEAAAREELAALQKQKYAFTKNSTPPAVFEIETREFFHGPTNEL